MFFSKKKKINEIDMSRLPQHIGIIMDGNGRWAKKRGLPRSAGHSAGADSLKKIITEANNLGVKYITVYAFSTENWKRPKEEVDAIMRLFKDYLLEAKSDITAAGDMKMKFIGERDGMSKELLELMDEAEEDTSEHCGTTIYLAVNYGGRLEICDAVNKLIAEGKTNITEKDISDNIFTPPECDLIIRPSGEQRLSNFMLWQAAYSEFWYSDVLWPDFKIDDLHQALRDFERRNRRFGG